MVLLLPFCKPGVCSLRHTHLTPWGILKPSGPYETDGIAPVSPALPSNTDPASHSKHSGSRPESL